MQNNYVNVMFDKAQFLMEGQDIKTVAPTNPTKANKRALSQMWSLTLE